MSDQTLGKKWEEVFKLDWKKQFPGTLVFRLKDQVSGYKETSQNPCDFFCFTGTELLMVECKEHQKASIPFTAIPQYERLLDYKGLKNVYPGALIWFSEKDIVIWVGIEEMEKMVEAGEKSIGIRMLTPDSPYNIIKVHAEKKKIFMACDFKDMVNQIVGGTE